MTAAADAEMSERAKNPTLPPMAARLNSFRRGGQGSVLDAISTMGTVEGLSAVELNFPQHLRDMSIDELAGAASENGLTVTGINLRYDGSMFGRGAFANPDANVRRHTIDLTIEAGAAAKALGATHVIVWPGPDGFDYPFQAPYRRLWDWVVEGMRDVASAHPDLRFSIEYKPDEPRKRSIVRSMSDALLAVRDIGLPNVGVTIDICHAQMAGEYPPAAVDLALREKRLYGLHLNDGYGIADDGMIAGSIHLWMILELLYLLRTSAYQGIIYFDTFPEPDNPVLEAQANIDLVRSLWNRIDNNIIELVAGGHRAQDPFTLAAIARQVLAGEC
jgi:xylose isomerase